MRSGQLVCVWHLVNLTWNRLRVKRISVVNRPQGEGFPLGYTDNYERDAYGILSFWVRNDYDHGRFLDREISHYEMELARTNQHMIQKLGTIWQEAEAKRTDLGTLLNRAEHATREWHGLLVHTMDRAIRCNIIISTPTSLLDHMIREAEESMNVFRLMQSGQRVLPADADLHESVFWLRQMADHLGFIQHYLDIAHHDMHEELLGRIRKFNNLLLEAQALSTIIRPPRREVLPILNTFNQKVIQSAQELEAFKLELDDLIKDCAVLTTAPPDLLEHIAREAHHLWRNLEDQVIR